MPFLTNPPWKCSDKLWDNVLPLASPFIVDKIPIKY